MVVRRFCVLIVLLAMAHGAYAQEAAPTDGEPRPGCDTCHLDAIPQWTGSSHALAFEAGAFQAVWNARGQDPTCLTCHTTGFERRTGAFTHEGVSCAACHGETPITHPREPIPADPGVERCGSCHLTTFTEWELSAHSADMTCTDCHSVHPEGLKAESADALCISCHTDPLTSYAHASHPDTSCAECHWHRAEVEPQHFVNGALLPSGHDGGVEPLACSACHSELDPDWQTTRVALIEPTQIEAAPEGGITLTNLFMGFALGGGLGVVLTALVVVRRSRR